MKQVVQSARSGKLAVKDVPEPLVRPGCVLVRTRASLISAGTERMVVEFAQSSMIGKAKARPDLVRKVIDKARRDGPLPTLRAVLARLDEPLPLGYSAAGEVVAVGPGIEGKFRVGQRVAIGGAGIANHAELNVVPENLVASVPDDVNDEEACFGTLGAIALHGVRNLGLELGDVAAVIGVGLVGQLAVEFLKLAGMRPIAFDYDEGRLELARFGGAELAWNLADGDPTNAVLDFTGGLGADGVLIAAATETCEPFELAAAVARDRARVALVGMTGTEIPYRAFMKKELSVVVSRSYGPGRYDDDYERRHMKYPAGYVRWTETRNLAETLRLMTRKSDRRLYVEQFITHRIPFAEAERAYKLVTERTEPHLGVVLRYADPAPAAKVTRLTVPRSVSPAKTDAAGKCVLAVIGAGAFARTVLLPRLAKLPNLTLDTIVTERGISAGHTQERFGFARIAAEPDAAFDDPNINAVLIATPHSSHARLTAAALRAGKNVLVEKPLALSRAELNDVIAARNRAATFLQVGFNRRFAPMTAKAKAHLARLGGPKFVLLRVNAGQLPPGSWQSAPEQGHGRILGEACHFIDLARHLVGAKIASVSASAAQPSRAECEDVTITLNFTDGSLATVAYTALGSADYSKELIEAYAGGTVVIIEDFRTLTIVTGGKAKRQRAMLDQDKGHQAELAAFVRAAAAGGPAPVDETELIESSLATIAALESLQTGAPVKL